MFRRLSGMFNVSKVFRRSSFVHATAFLRLRLASAGTRVYRDPYTCGYWVHSGPWQKGPDTPRIWTHPTLGYAKVFNSASGRFCGPGPPPIPPLGGCREALVDRFLWPRSDRWLWIYSGPANDWLPKCGSSRPRRGLCGPRNRSQIWQGRTSGTGTQGASKANRCVFSFLGSGSRLRSFVLRLMAGPAVLSIGKH